MYYARRTPGSKFRCTKLSSLLRKHRGSPLILRVAWIIHLSCAIQRVREFRPLRRTTALPRAARGKPLKRLDRNFLKIWLLCKQKASDGKIRPRRICAVPLGLITQKYQLLKRKAVSLSASRGSVSATLTCSLPLCGGVSVRTCFFAFVRISFCCPLQILSSQGLLCQERLLPSLP